MYTSSQALHQSDILETARLQAVFDSVVDSILIVNSQCLIESINPATESLFGYTKTELLGKNMTLLMPEPYAAEYDDYLRHYLTTGNTKVIGVGREVVGQCKDGSLFPMELAVSTMHIGEQTLFTGIIRDISDRKRVERELREANLQMHSILDNANYSIISTDLNGIIKTFNRGAQVMLGYMEAEVVNKMTPMILHLPAEIIARAASLSIELQTYIAADFEVFVAKSRLVLPNENEWTYIRKNGTHISVLLDVTAQFDDDGKIIGFLQIASDITERKRMERMKNEFISTVSHELRTPLTSIRGALNLVLAKASLGMSDKAKTLIEAASRNSERLTLLINDILDLEKIESGTLDFHMTPTDLVTITRQALISNEGYATQHNVTIVIRDTPNHALIIGDEHRLLQVFANFLSNAIKYSYANGIVEISITQIDHYFRVGVKDEGPGIPETFRKHMFQRFAQADSSDTRAKGGTGLGLSITKAIIERHGGAIAYDSKEGVGTEFYFKIPELKSVAKDTDTCSDIMT